jgi:hypothetical protein
MKVLNGMILVLLCILACACSESPGDPATSQVAALDAPRIDVTTVENGNVVSAVAPDATHGGLYLLWDAQEHVLWVTGLSTAEKEPLRFSMGAATETSMAKLAESIWERAHREGPADAIEWLRREGIAEL